MCATSTWSRRSILGLWLGLLVAGSGVSCQREEADVGAAVRLVAEETGEVAQRAMERVAQGGPRALIHIETALHTAGPVGRRNLVVVLRRLGAVDGVALLSHLAATDEDAGVRQEARWTLKVWAAQPGARGQAAAAALRQADEVRGTEEGA